MILENKVQASSLNSARQSPKFFPKPMSVFRSMHHHEVCLCSVWLVNYKNLSVLEGDKNCPLTYATHVGSDLVQTRLTHALWGSWDAAASL